MIKYILMLVIFSPIVIADEIYPLMVYSDKSYQNKIFEMENGACLKGPLKIYGKHHIIMFELKKDSYYPENCKGISK